MQRGPRLGRGIVDQDLQHWKPAKQLGAGLLSGLFVIVTSLEVTVDHKREAVGRRHICSSNVSGLNLVGQHSGLLHWVPSYRYRTNCPVSGAIIPTSRRDDGSDDVGDQRLRLVPRGRDASVVAEGGLGTGIVEALARQLNALIVTKSGSEGTSVSIAHHAVKAVLD